MTWETFIKSDSVQPRDYQTEIAKHALERNTLVVLPTGLGKTVVALLVMDRVLAGGKRVLFLAPTKPLAEQHVKSVLAKTTLGENDVLLLTGTLSPGKRAGAWKSTRVVSATPQTIENDLKKKRFSLGEFGLVVFDEAHRCVGKYAYTFVSEACRKAGVNVLALTASPGSSRKKIVEITETLGIDHVEARTEEDEDVRDYVQTLETEWVNVELPEEHFLLVKQLSLVIARYVRQLAKLGLAHENAKKMGKYRLVELRLRLIKSKSFIRYKGLSLVTLLMNLELSQELLETQSVGAFLDFFRKMEERPEKSKAVETILSDPEVGEVLSLARKLSEDHPKMRVLSEIISKRLPHTFLVFVQYRDQIRRIVEHLNKLKGVKARAFVGQKEGFTQKDQKQTIEEFRRGDFNVMVCSSIGEEGLDIPSVDCVIFYEPIASEIRSIQRRGRAGRMRSGEVVILITKGTRDEAYYWVSKKKEKKMRRVVETMSRGESLSQAPKSWEKKEKKQAEPTPGHEHKEEIRQVTLEEKKKKHSEGQSRMTDWL